MDREHPIDDSLNEIEKILKMLEKIKGKEISAVDFEDINRQLDVIDMDVDDFVEKTDEILKESGLSNARLKEALEVIPHDLPSDEQEALKKAKKLKEDIIRLKEEMTGSRDFEIRPPQEKKKEKMLSKEEHRKKYKRLGSKKKWKPL